MDALRPIGRVHSPLTDPAEAPRQGDEGAPDAWISIDPEFSQAARDLQGGRSLRLHLAAPRGPQRSERASAR